MDNIFEQIVNISKSGAYDVLSGQVKELKTVIRQLIEVGKLQDIAFTDEDETKLFQSLVTKAKRLSL